MRVAVTGAGGRLGRAVLESLNDAPFTGPGGAIAWSRPEFGFSHASIRGLLERDRPDAIVHCAAWTNVDSAARNEAEAVAVNGAGTGLLAREAAGAGADLIYVSTNEVFDGRRTDGRGYRADDEPHPINAYGVSKLIGEQHAASAYESSGLQLAIVRTAWLYGPPGNDFPSKILAAAERARAAGQPLKVVSDEIGSPTYSEDLAEAIVDLLANGTFAGIHHIVNGGHVSRAGWARELFRRLGVQVDIEEVPTSTWARDSTPPLWGVLEPTPLPSGEPMQSWQAALAHYVPLLQRQRTPA